MAFLLFSMEIIRIPVGLYQANAYVIKHEHQVLIVDPGARLDKIQAHIRLDDQVLGILLTHGHFDHIGAVDECSIIFKCPVYIEENEIEIVRTPEYNYSLTKKVSLKSKLTQYKPLQKLGAYTIEIIHAPGHTAGSVLIKIEDHLFTGDVLFKMDSGRTDLFSGSPQDMKRTLKMIRTLPPQLVIHPGHEEETTLSDELKNNPSLQ